MSCLLKFYIGVSHFDHTINHLHKWPLTLGPTAQCWAPEGARCTLADRSWAVEIQMGWNAEVSLTCSERVLRAGLCPQFKPDFLAFARFSCSSWIHHPRVQHYWDLACTTVSSQPGRCFYSSTAGPKVTAYIPENTLKNALRCEKK